jgi:maltose O-acetyltransferase
LHLAQLIAAPLPPFAGSRLRTYALRWAGFAIGATSVFWGMPTITGGKDLYHNLRIGGGCVFNAGCVFDLEAPIVIGDRVALGHQVLLLTSTHLIGPPERRAGLRLARAPVCIGDGAWLGSRCTVMPGVEIGAGAIVAAGALVNRDVPANSLVAGVPGRPVRCLEDEQGEVRPLHQGNMAGPAHR